MLSEIENYQNFLIDIHQQVNGLLANVPKEGLNWRPLGDEGTHETNSLAIMAWHVAGAEHFWIGEVVGELPATRDRDTEFVGEANSAEELIQVLDRTLSESLGFLQDPSLNLEREYLVRGKTVGTRWAILHAIDHISLHLGHMQITYQLWSHGKTYDSPDWEQRLPKKND